ncbi:hypothetical protein RRG08_017004 [Elysia crispata]|uniref:Uncharacterized protein n=1 Tax=Elysia crispata TaxID=231223 RepID=A0AAE0XZB6_9GAST|nr:hypothetical protein RRG08_017004 [Elysia crispata]
MKSTPSFIRANCRSSEGFLPKFLGEIEKILVILIFDKRILNELVLPTERATAAAASGSPLKLATPPHDEGQRARNSGV